VAFWDDNNISIDGEVGGWFTDDTPARFEAYGWHVIRDIDGHDAGAVRSAIEQAHGETKRPTLVCCKTIIGWGSPNKGGKASSHGAALGEDEVALVREKISWSHAPFEIPADIYTAWNAGDQGNDAQSAWQKRFENYRNEHPDLAAEFERRMAGQLPEDWQATAEQCIQDTNSTADKLATRQASQKTLNAFGPVLPEIIGGSADLTGSNLTLWSDAKPITSDDASGNYIYFGVREFGMSAITNGICLHGGFIPYAGTFLMFSEYARNALRMAALMQIPSIFVYTHDSVGLGEDGPTHQAVEQTATLRCIPNMSVWRPCDTVETAVAWQAAIESKDKPTSLLLSRQGLPCQARDAEQINNIRRGGYVLSDCAGEPQVIIIATGSEIELAMNAAQELASAGAKVRCVSMPSTYVFDMQDDDYKQSVLPDHIRQRLVIEAGVSNGWYKYVGSEGKIIGIDTFGESAPAGDVFKHFGFTVENVVNTVKELLT
ncbi:MAG: transketolase, partial [Gammaproteobacteria bacterium]|nr:transketolase [Gammaproteobacteria bacterium]